MSSYIYALLVDDDIDFANSLIREAKANGILIEHRTNYKDMEIFLEKKSSFISTIILDIKCLKEPNQLIEHEDFLAVALKHLDSNYNWLPRAILTADPEGYSIASKWYSQEKLYKKTPDETKELFSKVQQNSLELINIRIRNKYLDIFSLYDQKYLSDEFENELLELIKNIESNDLVEIKNNLTTVRRIQEGIFQTLNRHEKTIVPDYCFKANKDMKFHDIHKHLTGRKTKENGYLPTQTVYYSGIIEIGSLAIYQIASDNGAHNPYVNPDYMPTKYTSQYALYALFDLLRWFKVRMEEISQATCN
ncbi:hypothetical protein PMSD_15580 [Paenibacillus macquariensis subsp. defensor]|nr:hypothetical protein PMSD_15580 [Paenibacillus macquariensis subsp. defensor]